MPPGLTYRKRRDRAAGRPGARKRSSPEWAAAARTPPAAGTGSRGGAAGTGTGPGALPVTDHPTLPPPLTCTSTFTYMRGCESTVSPEPSSTCEAASAMVPPRRHGPEGHRRRRRFRFRHSTRYFRRARRPLPARGGVCPPPPGRHGSEGRGGGDVSPWRRGGGVCALRRRHGNGACGTDGA